MLPAVLRGLGFRLIPGGGLDAAAYGPPTPPMLVPLRRRRAVPIAEPAKPAVVPFGPFAALAALKR
jgi:hypothetical protein